MNSQLPTQPQRIARGTSRPRTQAGSPAPSRRRKRKKRNPMVLFFRGLARRLYFGGKTLFRVALLVPILVFMVAFSYQVDRSGLSAEIGKLRREGKLECDRRTFRLLCVPEHEKSAPSGADTSV